MILKRFSFSMICPIKKKNAINLNFHDRLYSSSFFKIKIQPIMCEQEKKRQRIYYLLNAETKPNFFYLLYKNQIKKFYSKKAF